jgi:hypothetical protein
MTNQARYHFSTRLNKPALCNANEKDCQYGTHYNSGQEAAAGVVTKALTPKSDLIEGITKPSIILTPSEYGEPTEHSLKTYLSLFEQPTTENAILYMLGKDETHNLPDELTNLAQENKEVLELDAPDSTAAYMLSKVQEWYWKQPNAVDSQGILEYVRSKGTETQGLTPLQAIKRQLDEENELIFKLGAHRNRALYNATHVEQKTVKLDEIIVRGASRLNEVEARIPQSYDNKPGIAGILVKTGDTYKLMDGYHRMKYLKIQNRKQANYIVLS